MIVECRGLRDVPPARPQSGSSFDAFHQRYTTYTMILNHSQPLNRILFWFYVSPVGLKVPIYLGGIPVGAQSAQ
jgi:hypothetical protein